MSTDDTGNGTSECNKGFEPFINKYVPYYRKLMRDSYFYTWEDLQNEIFLKLSDRFKEGIDWEKIDNKNAYLVVTARHMAFTLLKRCPTNIDSLAEEENLKSCKNLSDEGFSCSQIIEKTERGPLLVQINKMLANEFSDYERLLLQLNFIQGCKPVHVAEILIKEYPDILEKEYSGLLPADDQRKIKRLEKCVQTDCNAVKAKFRQKLRKKFTDGKGDSKNNG